MTATSCGIDFGTSNSTIGIGTPEGARLIALEDGSPTLPSAVFWDADGGAPLFGRAAITAYVGRDEGRLMRGLKSMPQRGDKPEWRHNQDYWAEKEQIPATDLESSEFLYDGVRAGKKLILPNPTR